MNNFKRMIERLNGWYDNSLIGFHFKATTKLTWNKTTPDLLEYNKTLIQLSSSSLVLSATVIQLGRIKIDKYLIGSSWLFFSLALIVSMLILYLNYMNSINNGIVERLFPDRKFPKDPTSEQRHAVIYGIRIMKYLYNLSIMSFLFFLTALIFLMCAFFKTL